MGRGGRNAIVDLETDYMFDADKMPDPNFVQPTLDDGSVEGWRAWAVSMDVPMGGLSPRLYSVMHHYYWTPKRLAEAECNRNCGAKKVISDVTGRYNIQPSRVPGEKCRCGFYSAKTLEHLQTMGYHAIAAKNLGMFCIVGQVANSGKVVEGSQGWRSQYSYPVKFYVPHVAWKLARPLANGYGVPVEIMNVFTINDDDEE